MTDIHEIAAWIGYVVLGLGGFLLVGVFAYIVLQFVWEQHCKARDLVELINDARAYREKHKGMDAP